MSSPPAAFNFTPWGRRRAESIGSVQSSQAGSTRRRRSPSASRIPHGGFHHPQQQAIAADSRLSSSFASGTYREPIRSFINATYRDNLATVSTAQYAKTVREDTAELATYQLADKTDGRSPSFLQRRRSLSLRTAPVSDVDSFGAATEDSSSRPGTGTEPIIETPSEAAAAAEAEADTDPGVDEGPSLLARALRRSPPQHRGHFDGESQEDESSRPNNNAIFSDEEEAGEAAESAAARLSASLDPAAHQPWLEVSDEPRNHVAPDGPPTESTPLLGSANTPAATTILLNGNRVSSYDLEGQKNLKWSRWQDLFSWRWKKHEAEGEDAAAGNTMGRVFYSVTHPASWDRQALWQNAVVAPVACLPAVIVGLLLNILDALSYGMILFPLGTPIFSHLGSAGISIFYVSTIVSQLTYSSRSIFKGGVGSELIEVVPFFHSMAATIMDIVGENEPDAVIATTITSYALSSVVTGAVFYLMGRFKFGYIVGFIPRHILIGCIGGVGWFLIATGFEVTARIEGSLEYDLDTLHKLLQNDTIPLWITPLVLSLALFWGQKYITNKYFLPLYILTIPFFFYFFALITGPFDPVSMRSHGWVFEGPPAGEPWWYFYTLFQFNKVHWGAVIQCIPAMLALTFFGILNVPINVPALALQTGEDHADLNHELKLHGYSNILSGAMGSIQNYLVYANTLFFIRSGGNSRLAGFELAFLTFCVMLIGPQLIGFIPIMMVGCLIFDLGFELLVEAVWLPRKKLKLAEYATVIAIVLIMGIYDFVVGIGVGILLAFVSLIFQASQVSAVRSTYSGETVTSTVRRNPAQQHYLQKVGRQTCIIKLAGYLFFGTIVSVESKIRELISDDAFDLRPIRYVIIDLRQVTGLDYSAGEAFNTISRLLDGKGIQLVLSSVDAESTLGHDLRAVGLGEDGIEVAFLPDINTALELCENELLKTLYASQAAQTGEAAKAVSTTAAVDAASSRHLLADAARPNSPSVDLLASSPRRSHLQAAARELLLLDETEDLRRRRARWQNFSEPLRLMLQIFADVSEKDVDFWYQASRYFVRREYAAGEMLFRADEVAEGFFLIEKGIVRAEYDLAHGQGYHESIVAGTTCGELPFFSQTQRTATAYADMPCTVWVLDRDAWHRLQQDHPDVAFELLQVSLKLTAERMCTVPSSTMLMAD